MKVIIISLVTLLIPILLLSFFTMPTLYLFSPIEGIILANGKPVSHAKLVRVSSSEWFDGDKKYTEETTTDENWKFSFPLRKAKFWISRLLSWLPHEAVISQEIILNQWDKTYPIWWAVKRNYDLFGELKTEFQKIQKWSIRISCTLEDVLESDNKVEIAISALWRVQ